MKLKTLGVMVGMAVALTGAASIGHATSMSTSRPIDFAIHYTDGNFSVEGREIYYCDGGYEREGTITMYSEYVFYGEC